MRTSRFLWAGVASGIALNFLPDVQLDLREEPEIIRELSCSPDPWKVPIAGAVSEPSSHLEGRVESAGGPQEERGNESFEGQAPRESVSADRDDCRRLGCIDEAISGVAIVRENTSSSDRRGSGSALVGNAQVETVTLGRLPLCLTFPEVCSSARSCGIPFNSQVPQVLFQDGLEVFCGSTRIVVWTSMLECFDSRADSAGCGGQEEPPDCVS